MKITRILAREILNSRGCSTLQCDIELDNKHLVSSFVPNIIPDCMLDRFSISKEIDELRDIYKSNISKINDCINNIENIIAPMLINKNPNAIDMDIKLLELDGTIDKSNLGINVLSAVSMALYKAESVDKGIKLFELIAYAMGNQTVTLPFPIFNIISNNHDINENNFNSNLKIKEFMIVPIAAETFRYSLSIAINIFNELRHYLHVNNIFNFINDRGSIVCEFKTDEDALDVLSSVIRNVSKNHSVDCFIALGSISISHKHYDIKDLINWYEKLINSYPIYSIEDGVPFDDITGWQELYNRLSSKALIVGDGLFSSDIKRINEYASNSYKHQIAKRISDGVIIRPNQVGTITEVLQIIKLCKEKQLNTIISCSLGDTEDNFISDLAVGAQSSQIKSGGLVRSEHLSKYNRLLAIEDFLSISLFDT